MPVRFNFITLCTILLFILSVNIHCYADEPKLVSPIDIAHSIDNAHTSILLSSYSFWPSYKSPLIRSLKGAIKRGLKVRVIYDARNQRPKTKKQLGSDNRAITRLKKWQALGDFKWQVIDKAKGALHSKYVVVDHSIVFISTGNFPLSKVNISNHYDLVIATKDPVIISDLIHLFHHDWSDINLKIQKPHAKQLIVSPYNSLPELKRLILATNQSINAYVPYNHHVPNTIIRALRKAISRKVKIVFLSNGQFSNANQRANNLCKKVKGIHIGLITSNPKSKRYLHTKAYIFDAREALIGSLNFSYSAFKFNREVSLVVHNPTLINSILSKFHMQSQKANWIC